MDPYSYYYDFSYGTDMDIIVFLLVFLAVYAIMILAMLAIGLVQYIFQSISFYTIAKRRGIKSPWLGWIPVGNMWILGSIADQYQYVKKGKVSNLRKWLIGGWLAIFGAELLLMVPYVIMLLAPTFGLADVFVIVTALLVMLMAFVMMAIAIAYAILQYMAIYNLFESCAQDRAVLYLLLSFFVPFAITVLFFICRNKDDGMPPRLEDLEALEENAE